MTDTKPTICWNCNSSYSITDAECPSCEAHNANVNIDAANLQSALQVAQQELEVQMVGWSDCEEKLTKAEADHKAAEQNVSDLMAEVAQTGALLMKAEASNKRLVELVEHAKTQFQAYLNGPCTFTKSRTSTDCGCVSCTTRNAMTDLLREVGK